jgi:two-component system sensor histidine kinase KdpD
MGRGTWRIYLGVASGAGKTYAMLDEGRRRAQRGTHVVIGLADAKGRPGTEQMLAGLERVPSLVIDGHEVLDVDRVLARHPEVCLVDDLATPNPPGAERGARWEDVAVLLDAGIEVVSTLDVEQLASLQDVVDELTGTHGRATIPDDVVRRADQVELVDMSPESLRRRLAHGNIVTAEAADAPTVDYFRVEVLAGLRELALLWVADRIWEPTIARGRPVDTRERVAVAITGAPSSDRVVRRAARLAGRAGGDLVGIHVQRPGDLTDRPEAVRSLLEDLGGRWVEVEAEDVATALVNVARSEGATQLVLGAGVTRHWPWSRRSVVTEVLHLAGAIDVHVMSAPVGTAAPPRRPKAGGAALPARRRLLGWVLAVTLPPLLAVALVPHRRDLDLATVLLAFLLVAILPAAVGGTGPALLAGAFGFGLANWYFTEPVGSWTIAESEHVLALALTLPVAGAVGVFVARAARQANAATRARADAAALARAAVTTTGSPDPLQALLELVLGEVGAERVAVVAGPQVVASAGRPEDDDESVARLPVGEGAQLVVWGPRLDPPELALLAALAAQVAAALARRRLAEEAASASDLAAANDLRGAILSAASHDLRSPLASIKAAVSSLLADDVEWDQATHDEFLATIDQETDRLTELVTNLLDLSRLQAGAVTPATRPVGLDEVVGNALSSLGHGASDVTVVVDETLPRVIVDPGLLERAVANLVQNALRHGGGAPVRVEASTTAGELVLRVVDRGPGVARRDRERLFRPFEQAGEAGGPGVGLGLAVSRGFIEASGGRLAIEDTPGGGCTMVATLPTVAAGPPRVRVTPSG